MNILSARRKLLLASVLSLVGTAAANAQSLPIGPIGHFTGRQLLTTSATYYVATTGSDTTGNGSSSAPWATLQNAINWIAQNIDGGGNGIEISVGTGSFAGVGMKPMVGCPYIYINGAGKSSTTITAGPNDGTYNFGECISYIIDCGVSLFVNNVTLNLSTAPGDPVVIGVYASGSVTCDQPNNAGGDVAIVGNASGYMVQVENSSAKFYDSGNNLTTLTLSGNCKGYVYVSNNAFASIESKYTISGTPAWSAAFAQAQVGGAIQAGGATYSGSATGSRYLANLCGSINTEGGGASFFPGSTAGATTNGGEYA